MIPRNSLHKTSLQQITHTSTKSNDSFSFQGKPLFLQDISVEHSQDVLKSLRINIQKYKWKETKALTLDLSKVIRFQAKRVTDLLSEELASTEKLDLDLRNWTNNDTGSKLESLAYKISRNCKDLKHLTLVIRLDLGILQAMQIFAKELVRVQNLKTLSLQSKKSTNLPKDGIEILSKFLSRSNTLQELTICLNGVPVSFSMNGFALWICTKLTKLQMLNLEFEETDLDDEGTKELTFRIAKNLKDLKHLRLFCGDTKVTEEGIQACMKNLQPINENLIDFQSHRQ